MNLKKAPPFAHRGLHDNIDIVENSMTAFSKAIDCKFGIELDLRMTKDGNIIVFHDSNIMRLCGKSNRIEKMTLNEIKQLKLLGSEDKIPTFQEFLNLVDGKVPIIIEVKQNIKISKIMENIFSILGCYNGEYYIESFDPFLLFWLKKYKPQVERGQLASAFINEFFVLRWILKSLYLCKFNKPNFIAYDINSLPNKRLTKFLDKNPSTVLVGWTIKTEEELAKAKIYCDNIIFENQKIFER